MGEVCGRGGGVGGGGGQGGCLGDEVHYIDMFNTMEADMSHQCFNIT